MKFQHYQLIAYLLLGAVILSACSTIGGPNPALDSMPDTTWLLHSYGPPTDLTPALADARVTLGFDFEEGTASGNAGCNHFSGSFSLKGAKLSFGNMMSTLMACFPEEIMQQESVYTQLLGQVSSYEISDGFLVLFTEDGQTIRFQPLASAQ